MKAKEMLDEVRKGGEIHIVTCLRHTRIDKKCLDKFEKLGAFLFKDDGDNFRLASGQNSVYVFRNSVTLQKASC